MDASEPRRFTLNMHGLGAPHSGVPDSERRYWCTEDTYETLLDEIVRLAAEHAGDIGFHVTFDDGNKSDLTIGVPALKARGLTATFFVCSDRLDDPAYLSPADLEQMEAEGMLIGCHGATHIPLRDVTPEVLDYETRGAKARLEDALGHRVAEFAIPFGSYNRKVMKALDPFDKLYTSDHQISSPMPGSSCGTAMPTTGSGRPSAHITRRTEGNEIRSYAGQDGGETPAALTALERLEAKIVHL